MNTTGFEQYQLSGEIQKALAGLEYQIPTQVQERVIPVALTKKDLIVRSQTGSGKTAAYAIPVCESVDWLENKPQALILTPTRELAVQVNEDFKQIGRFKRIKAAALYGGHRFSIEKTELKQKTHIVTGTPGRVLDHIEKGTLSLDRICFLIIDEADRMLEMGFMDQVEAIIRELPDTRVSMLFSATMPDKILNLAQNDLKDPIYIDISQSNPMTPDITHFCYRIEEEDKFKLLVDVAVVENPDRCILFCNTKDQVDLVYKQLLQSKIPCIKIHGGMEQDQRLSAIQSFKKGEYRYLVATDVAARGIDIDNISLVIHYDMPLTGETYVHRTGRTGRAGKKGKAISFVTSKQTRYLREIEIMTGYKIQELKEPGEEEVSSHQSSFLEKIKEVPQVRKTKWDEIDKEIMKLRFNGGKKKKLRAANFVGVLSNLEGMTAEDIGIISIQDTLTYIEILNGKGPLVLEGMKDTKVNGKQLKVIEAVEKNTQTKPMNEKRHYE